MWENDIWKVFQAMLSSTAAKLQNYSEILETFTSLEKIGNIEIIKIQKHTWSLQVYQIVVLACNIVFRT